MVVSSKPSLTGNIPSLRHVLPTPVYEVIMETWNFWSTNSIYMASQSAKSSGGTLGAHTHKLRILVGSGVSS